ncbi:hypothetical protein F4813DRAFT_399361 [Daldinia decipiens]|uniref:uncharacterized protein n=1 Tax=Daldinia decipiens TaxID=326647 RepID=UPI0020C52603|nr:uncharacterized protein F4813DRAFT_399361 [Daldinia decipiens]KAI1661452.1 hypothetical protein F4813DRAFT_399361 [Daldinia decipiens]
MKTIKKLLVRKGCEEKSQDNTKNGKHENTSSFEEENSPHGTHTISMDYIPQNYGMAETLIYLHSGSPFDLARLFDKRDRAKGTKEVELVLREPTIRSVKQLYQICKQAEVVAKYGLTGRIAYNFSKSTDWNRLNISRLPSLQPRKPREPVRKPSGLLGTSAVEPDFDMSTFSFSTDRPMSPVSEAGACRDLPHAYGDLEVGSPNPPVTLDLSTVEEDEGEVSRATSLTMTKIPIWQVRMVHIPPRISLHITDKVE